MPRRVFQVTPPGLTSSALSSPSTSGRHSVTRETGSWGACSLGSGALDWTKGSRGLDSSGAIVSHRGVRQHTLESCAEATEFLCVTEAAAVGTYGSWRSLRGGSRRWYWRGWARRVMCLAVISVGVSSAGWRVSRWPSLGVGGLARVRGEREGALGVGLGVECAWCGGFPR